MATYTLDVIARVCVAIGANLLMLGAALADTPDAILGVWVNGAGDGYIEMARDAEEYYGTIIGGPDPSGAKRVDDKNPDPALRVRPLLGLKILEGFKRQGSNKWVGGTIYDPNNGKTYKCRLELLDANTLSVRGYIGVPLFGRTETWTRKNE